MKNVINSVVERGLKKFGIENSSTNRGNPGMYINSLEGAISVKSPLNIIQVGANDGKYNDPIYEFVKEHKHSTNIVLIEPIKQLIPHLEENYSYHPSSEIFNKAIGNNEASFIRLYRIKRQYWGNIDVGYGKNWPNYRVPTGITTSNKNQLIHWISKNVQSDQNPEEIIEAIDVEIIRPNTIIEQSEIIEKVELLQVDVEGMDDEIVYSFLDDNIAPNIINIERNHLDKAEQKKFDRRMKNKGYKIYDYTPNEKIAFIQRNPNSVGEK